MGHHNIKSTQVSCTDPTTNLFNWNVTAIMPDGLLIASNYQDNVKITWQYHFTSPIVRVWKWNGHELTEIDLFQSKSDKEASDTQVSPAIYVGMHKKQVFSVHFSNSRLLTIIFQLYIHESFAWQNKLHYGTEIVQTERLGRIPWKPISASGLLTEDDSTATSVLYSSEYVNGSHTNFTSL